MGRLAEKEAENYCSGFVACCSAKNIYLPCLAVSIQNKDSVAVNSGSITGTQLLCDLRPFKLHVLNKFIGLQMLKPLLK